jgi:hypothetical protein
MACYKLRLKSLPLIVLVGSFMQTVSTASCSSTEVDRSQSWQIPRDQNDGYFRFQRTTLDQPDASAGTAAGRVY